VRVDHRIASLVVAGTLTANLVSGCIGPEWSKPSLEVPSSEQGHIYVCLDLPKEQLPAAHVAVSQWDRALHQWKNVVAVDGGMPWKVTCTVWVHESTDTGPGEAANHHSLAWASALGGSEVSLRKGWYEQDTVGILMHELGHVFGAQHVPGTLMDPQWSSHTFKCPDATTVAQVAAWNQINLESLSHCYQ
jgi:hypothetical protein